MKTYRNWQVQNRRNVSSLFVHDHHCKEVDKVLIERNFDLINYDHRNKKKLQNNSIFSPTTALENI